MEKKDQKKNRCRGDGKQKNLGIGVTGKRTKKSPRADGGKKGKTKNGLEVTEKKTKKGSRGDGKKDTQKLGLGAT